MKKEKKKEEKKKEEKKKKKKDVDGRGCGIILVPFWH
jgi:hypothetical protein